MQKHVACLLVLLASPLTVKADVLYSTVGPSQSFGSGGYTVEDSLGWASPFETTATGALSSVDLPLQLQGGNLSVQVTIASDSSGSPGAAIESFTINNLSATPTVNSANSVLTPTLSAGTPYWFEVVGLGPNPGSDIGQWYDNNQGLTQTVDITSNGGASWSVFSAGEADPAFDVNGSVPEPTAFLATTFLGFLILRGRSRGDRSVGTGRSSLPGAGG